MQNLKINFNKETMSVGLEMWRFSEDINTARRFNMRIQHPHCPSVLYSGIYLIDL